jgi:FkbM family methyltransferase
MPIRTCTVRGLTVRLDLDSEEEGEERNYEMWRAGHYATKEPDTLDWIDAHFRPGDTIYDVGANIGQYALYAAQRLGGAARILAFEPEALNFAKLNRNIVLNNQVGTITAYPLAVADTTGPDTFHVKAFTAGASLHALGRSVTQGEVAFQPGNLQGTMSVSLDDLVNRFAMPAPAHIKIDVDGIEERIVAGAHDLLRETGLRTVLIEIFNHGDVAGRIHRAFDEAGLTLSNADDIDPDEGRVNNHIYVR